MVNKEIIENGFFKIEKKLNVEFIGQKTFNKELCDYFKEKIEEDIDLLGTLNHKAQIIKSNNNEDFEKALDESKLLENNFLRNMRVKIIDYMRK